MKLILLISEAGLILFKNLVSRKTDTLLFKKRNSVHEKNGV